MSNKRSLILILDMLAGHWAEGSESPVTGLPYPNVKGYEKAGLLPNFGECIKNGIYANVWNMGNCNTPYGQKYLASGTYQTESAPGIDPYWSMVRGQDKETILQACKRTYPGGKVASFGSDAWMQTGWWKGAECTMGWGSYYSDFLTSQNAFHWMMSNPDWSMALLYLAQYDMTGNCPVYAEGAAYTEDKHHSLLQLDRLLWMVKTFLKEQGWWEDTWLFIGSDHGCHAGCNIAVQEGRERGVAEADLSNYCSNHQAPYDCHIWDFAKNRATDKRSDCCRRTTFIITGGALSREHYGRVIDKAEIIDFAPTVAEAMKIDFAADGKSILTSGPEKF